MKREDFVAKSILEAREAYEEGKPYITDEHYDELMETLRELNPKHPALNRHESPVNKGDVEMPFCLTSLAKVRPDMGAPEWLERNNIKAGLVVSAKLDGLAAQAIYEGGKLTAMYSSSDDGYTGKDITHMAPHIKNLPKRIDAKGYVAVRLELVVSRSAFETVAGEYKNARNLASGIKNKVNGLHEHIGLMSAVALGMLAPRKPPKDAFEQLEDLGFTVAKHKFFAPDSGLNCEKLSAMYASLKAKYAYDTDGVVIEKNIRTSVPDSIPTHMVAFKNNLLLDSAEARVIDVLWEVSRYNKMTPVLLIEPVQLEGTTVQRVTGHNAKFILDNRIGPDAVVKVIKSGSIIPKVEGVIKTGRNPFKNITDKYRWNDTKVDIYLRETAKDSEAEVRRVTHFFNVLGVEGLRIGTVRKLYEEGYVGEKAVLEMSEGDWGRVVGANGKKIFSSLQEVCDGLTIPQVAYASGVFGRGMGLSKLEAIYELFGSIENFVSAEETGYEELLARVTERVGPKTATMFVENLNAFVSYLLEMNLTLAEPAVPDVESAALNGINVCFTGVRNAELESLVTAHSGSIASGVNGKTTHLVVKSHSFSSSKVEAAKKLGIPTYTEQEFKDYIEELL